MSDAVAETSSAAPAATAPKKAPAAKKTAAAKKPAKSRTHPPAAEMVLAAIAALKDKKGSSLQAIKKYIAATYTCDIDKQSTFIKKFLKSAVEKKTIVQTKGSGAAGSFKLAAKAEGEKKVAKKPAVKKPAAKKPAGEKKAAAKKPAAEKKVAKKPAAAAKKTKVAAKPKTVKQGRGQISGKGQEDRKSPSCRQAQAGAQAEEERGNQGCQTQERSEKINLQNRPFSRPIAYIDYLTKRPFSGLLKCFYVDTTIFVFSYSMVPFRQRTKRVSPKVIEL